MVLPKCRSPFYVTLPRFEMKALPSTDTLFGTTHRISYCLVKRTDNKAEKIVFSLIYSYTQPLASFLEDLELPAESSKGTEKDKYSPWEYCSQNREIVLKVVPLRFFLHYGSMGRWFGSKIDSLRTRLRG